MTMKPTDTNAKSGNLSDGVKNGVCKDFKDIWKLMDLVTELQNSERTLPTNGAKGTEEKINYGNRSK
jgi:hypothetical protein